MSYNAKVFNVMIASPGDVASERSIIRDVIYEWNAVHSIARNIVLMPIGWETHSSPEMGGEPQKIINSQILEKSDILVGVFGTRIGTATSSYASGTVEEIERHIEAGKLAMVYFSSQPVVLDTVDLNQVSEVNEFKKFCRNRGLYEVYDNHSDFKEKFYRHLQIKLNEHQLFADLKSDSISEIKESNTKIPELTYEARILLKEAILDRHGNIMFLKYIGGQNIQTNGKNFIQTNDRREVAKWEAALEELVDNGLLIERGNNGASFDVTALGYQIADMIQL